MSKTGPSIPAVKTARLEFRIVQESDLDDFHAIWSNPAVAKWSTRGTCRTLEESRSRMAGLFANPEKPESINYGIFIRSSAPAPDSETTATPISSETGSNRMIGIIGVTREPSPGTAEIGYIFNQSFWGQGYASEALAAYLEIYWDHVKTINTMVAMVDPENTPSIKVLRKCGFKEIEYLVGAIVLPEMGRRDTVVYSYNRG